MLLISNSEFKTSLDYRLSSSTAEVLKKKRKKKKRKKAAVASASLSPHPGTLQNTEHPSGRRNLAAAKHSG